MLHSKKAPVVTLQVWVKTGSALELSTEAGLSHFIEHLVFKGTESFKAGEIAQVVESVGGELNAYTSFDQTVFYVTVPKKSLKVAAHVLSEMMTSPLFDPVEVDNEREVVIEEIKMGMDQAGRVASKMLFSQMYEGHPYALPVIGTEENIRRVEVSEIKNYFEERYVGKNMSLVCVGDFEEDAKAVLEQYFKGVKHIGLPDQPRVITRRKLSETNRFQITESTFEKDHCYISWPVEGYLNPMAEKYEMLALLLGQGESSYLYKELKLKRGLCRSVGASYFGDKDDGIFVISAVLTSDEREKFFEELPKALKDFFLQTDVSKDLEKARNIFDSEGAYAEESIASMCRTIGDDWLYYNDPVMTEKRNKVILSLTEKDLIEASKSFLSEKAYVSVLSQKKASDKEKNILNTLDGLKNPEINFVESTNNIKKDEQASAVISNYEEHEWTTSKGSRVSFVAQPLGSVVSFKVAFEGGELLAKENQQGLVSLFGNVWARAFKDMSEQDFIENIDFYCSGFSAFAGKHSVGLNLLTLKAHFITLSDYFIKSLKEPVFSKDLIEREKETLMQSLKTRVDRPSAIAFKEFSQLMFKDSVYSRDSVGVVEHLEEITETDLKTFFDVMKKQRRVYSVVGNLSRAEVEKAIEFIEDGLPKAGPSLFEENVSFNRGEGQALNIETDKNQAHIIMGYPGLKYDDPKKLHLELITSLLGGQGGRLFIELRDKASLAYSVAPLEYSGLYGGYFGGYIACDPSKKELAIKMMRTELQRMSEEEVTPEELDWMKTQVLGGFAMSAQKNSFICDTMLFDSLYGLEAFEYKRLEESLNQVTPKDLKETISKILAGPEYIVTVG